jgi:hypothetical protein
MDPLVSEHFESHPPQLGVTPDREGFKQYFLRLATAFPDLEFDVHDLIAEGGPRGLPLHRSRQPSGRDPRSPRVAANGQEIRDLSDLCYAHRAKQGGGEMGGAGDIQPGPPARPDHA